MDNEKDFYIKEMLKKDELISKKAEDVFNNFLEDEIKMEKEKIVNINKVKDKKFDRKKILSIVATLVVVFLGANVYAFTQGYNNIFFMIEDLSTRGKISGKSNILKDEDITLSYEPIKIAEGITVQFNRFIIKDNKATLLMWVSEEMGINPDKKISQVEVISGNNDSDFSTVSLLNEHPGSYTKEIELDFFNDDIKTLIVNINAKKENLSKIEIDLLSRQITIINNSYKEIEKISEVELKEVLGNYAILNFYNDTEDSITDVYGKSATKQQCINYDLVNCAINYINNKEVTESNGQVDTIYYTVEKVNKAIKEMTGIEVEDHIDMIDGFCYYNKTLRRYDFEAGDGVFIGLCLNITNISFEDGIYSVDYQYCYPTEGDFVDNTINRLPVYESSLQFKLNENYEYIKYNIVSNIYNLKSKLISKGNENNINSNTIYTENTIYENNTISTSNTVNTNTFIEEESFGEGFKWISDVIIESRWSDKIKNYKDFNYDLDGDGVVDKITIRKDKNNQYNDRNYLFELNGQIFTENDMSPEIYIIDLDKNDNTLEVIIYDAGPSDDPEYSIYAKEGNQMKLLSIIHGIDMVFDSNGNFKVKSILTDRICDPFVYDIVYNFNNNYISSKAVELDITQDYHTFGGLFVTKDLNNIDRYFEYMSENLEADSDENLKKADIIELNIDDKFKIKSFIDESRAIVEYKGEEYYLLSFQRNFCD